MTNKFWKGKRVLVTGYEGFLGSNLTKSLISYGADIVGLDIKVKRRHTILTKEDYGKIIVIKGNVANYKLLKEVISNYNIEIIFHLAAEAIVGECLKNPLKTFNSNIKGTWNILDVCRNLSALEAVIIASSDKAYGSYDKLPYKENVPLSGEHPYDVSKSCADLITYTYHNTYGLPVAVTRCGNIFGPGDFNFSRIIPDTIKCMLSQKTLLIRSDGEFTRDYIYVGDIVDGYIILAEKLQELKLFGEAFNFSYENPISVLDLVEKIYKISDRKPDYKILGEAKYEIKHQYLSSEKAKKILDWKPKDALSEGIKKTIEWHRDYFNNNKSLDGEMKNGGY